MADEPAAVQPETAPVQSVAPNPQGVPPNPNTEPQSAPAGRSTIPADAPAPVGEGSESGAAPPPPAQPDQSSEAPAESVAPPAAPEAAPSLLSEAAAKETPPAEPEKPAEPEVPHYEAFNLPEGFRVSEDRLAPFVGFLGENKLTQEQGQALIDLHVAEVQRLRDEMQQGQYDTHNAMRAEWRDRFEKDPDLGGNRRQMTLNSAVGVLRHFANDAEHFARVTQVFDFTGAGDHPDIIRWLANAARGLAQQYREGAPVSAGQPAPVEQSRYRRRYATNGSARQ